MQVGPAGRAPDLTLVRPQAFGLTYLSMHAPLYFNGRYTTTAERVIGVEDRGFQFGDGLYEVIKYTRRHPLLVTEHLQRLAGGLAALEIASPMNEAEWRSVFAELIERAGAADGTIYLQITRGETPRSHLFPLDLPVTVVAYVRALQFPKREARVSGVAAVTAPDLRWSRCDIKTLNLLGSVLARQEARRREAAEALLIRNDVFTEGAHSNVFFVIDGMIATHPADERILHGTVRDQVVRIAREAGLSVVERPVSVHEAELANEAFVTSTTQGVMPLRTIDERPLGGNAVGLRLGDLYAEFEERLIGR